MSILDVKDRLPTNVLSNKAVRYGVYDEEGNLLRYEYIKREDEPVEEGTLINKGFFDNLYGDLYTSDRYNIPTAKFGEVGETYISHENFCNISWEQGSGKEIIGNSVLLGGNIKLTTSNDATTAYQAFDGSVTTGWGTQESMGVGWLQIELPFAVKINKMKTYVTGYGNYFQGAFVQGSNDENARYDENAWDLLYSISNKQTKVTAITLNNPSYYKYYRIKIAYNSNYANASGSLYEWEMSEWESNRAWICNLSLPLTSYEKGKIANIKFGEISIEGKTEWKFYDRNNSSQHFDGIAYGNGVYVGVGQSALIMTSQDGIEWTKPELPTDLNVSFYGCDFFDGKFHAYGSSYKMAVSEDGVNWHIEEQPITITYKILKKDDLYVAVGYGEAISISHDSINWEQKHTSNNGASDSIFDIAYGNGIYVATGDGFVVTSTDGETWTERTISGAAVRFYRIAYGNGIFILTGNAGKTYKSTDGINWTLILTENTYTFHAMCFANNQFVMATGEKVYISTDANEWEIIDYTSSNPDARAINDIVYGDKGYVAVGNYGSVLTGKSETVSVTKNIYLDINGLGAKPINGFVEQNQNSALIYNGESWEEIPYIRREILADYTIDKTTLQSISFSNLNVGENEVLYGRLIEFSNNNSSSVYLKINDVLNYKSGTSTDYVSTGFIIGSRIALKEFRIEYSPAESYAYYSPTQPWDNGVAYGHAYEIVSKIQKLEFYLKSDSGSYLNEGGRIILWKERIV